MRSNESKWYLYDVLFTFEKDGSSFDFNFEMIEFKQFLVVKRHHGTNFYN